MRQGGFKPKGHNSGTYWVRANANSGGGETKHSANEAENVGDALDDLTSEEATIKGNTWALILGILALIGLICIGVTHSP